jgi:hypothetical protein
MEIQDKAIGALTLYGEQTHRWNKQTDFGSVREMKRM